MIDYAVIKSRLAMMGGVVVGYSGGVDSTLLAKAATDALGQKAVCVLIETQMMPEAEVIEAVESAQELGLNLIRISVDALAIAGVPENSPDRCYHCKKALFSKLLDIARERGLPYVIDGSNADDNADYRPGSRASAELGVRGPFQEMGLTKERIRAISREVGLATWNKPSYACLASRIPYGTYLTSELLRQVEGAEAVLRSLGFQQFRVRSHGEVARIELMPLEMGKIVDPAVREHIVRELRSLGYSYVALDLVGYRMGSMNEVLDT